MTRITTSGAALAFGLLLALCANGQPSEQHGKVITDRRCTVTDDLYVDVYRNGTVWARAIA